MWYSNFRGTVRLKCQFSIARYLGMYVAKCGIIIMAGASHSSHSD